MAKRSRETSFSPSAEELSAPETNGDCSDVEADRFSKYKLVDPWTTPATATASAVMRCSLPPHKTPLDFQSHDDYEVHYLQEHTNRCSSCGKNFPTAHLLGLHIEENHNALRETLQARGEKTYACFVEDCDRKCSSPHKRRLHLIDKHGFPKLYNFRIVDKGIDRTASLLRDGQKRRVSLSNEACQSIGHQRRASSQTQLLAQMKHALTVVEGPQPAVNSEMKPHLHPANGSVRSQPPKPAGSVEPLPPPAAAAAAPDDISDLETSMSALRFVPTSVVLRKSKPS